MVLTGLKNARPEGAPPHPFPAPIGRQTSPGTAACRIGRAGADQNALSTLCGASTTGPRGALGADVGADVRAVGGDRVGVAVEVAQRQVRQRVRRRCADAPRSSPTARTAPRARRAPSVGRRQRDAARQPGDDRAEAPGGGEPQHAALARPRAPGTAGRASPAPPPWRTSPPISANTTSSRSCSAANAPTRNGGAWLVTNRTGRLTAPKLRAVQQAPARGSRSALVPRLRPSARADVVAASERSVCDLERPRGA